MVSYSSSKTKPPQQPQSHTVTAPARVRLTDTYSVATTCRSKLGKEADRADHQLRRLVGHANMLDKLMDQLIDGERRQERRVNALIRAVPEPQQPRKVLWIDRIAEELEEAEDSDSDDDSGAEDETTTHKVPLRNNRKVKSPLPKPWEDYLADDDSASDDDEDADSGADDEELVLRRCPTKMRMFRRTRDSGSGTDDWLSSRLQETCLNSTAAQASITAKKAQDCVATVTKALTFPITLPS